MMQGTGGMQQSPDGMNLDPGGYQQPLYLQQEHAMQPINVRCVSVCLPTLYTYPLYLSNYVLCAGILPPLCAAAVQINL